MLDGSEALKGCRILIMGSNSFAGSWLVKAALSQGMNVLGINRSDEKGEAFLPYLWQAFPGQYQFHALHLNDHFEQIRDLVNNFKPEYVVDFAGQGMVAESWQSPEQWYLTNVASKSRFIQLLKDHHPQLKKYIRASTPEVYGSTDELITESRHYNPSTPYAVSHAAIDMHLHAYVKQYDFPAVITRFSNFYGPGQQLYRIIPRTILFARMGKILPLHGGGLAVRAFIYGEDVANGLLTTLLKGQIGDIYHFSTDRFVTIRDLVEQILLAQGIDFNSAVEVTADRPGKDARYLMSDQKVRQELGWQEQVSLEQGIQNTVEWVDRYWDQLRQQPLDYIHRP